MLRLTTIERRNGLVDYALDAFTDCRRDEADALLLRFAANDAGFVPVGLSITNGASLFLLCPNLNECASLKMSFIALPSCWSALWPQAATMAAMILSRHIAPRRLANARPHPVLRHLEAGSKREQQQERRSRRVRFDQGNRQVKC